MSRAKRVQPSQNEASHLLDDEDAVYSQIDDIIPTTSMWKPKENDKEAL